MTKKYDVLLKYRYRDRDRVRYLYNKLQHRYLTPWLDEVDVLPGKNTEAEFQKVTSKAKVIAVFIGEDGYTDPQAANIKKIFEHSQARDLRLIPVLLDSFENLPENLSFLNGLQPVRFHKFDDEIRENASVQRLKNSIEEKYEESRKAQPQNFAGTYLAKASNLIDKDKKRYQDLIASLKNHDFYEASNETENCLKGFIPNSQNRVMIESGELLEIPCGALQIINYLWLHYSDEKHGFSVQRQIYEDCGGLFGYKYIDEPAYSEFAEVVGWISASDSSKFPIETRGRAANLPKGHFPYWSIFPGKGTFLYRLKVCGI